MTKPNNYAVFANLQQFLDKMRSCNVSVQPALVTLLPSEKQVVKLKLELNEETTYHTLTEQILDVLADEFGQRWMRKHDLLAKGYK